MYSRKKVLSDKLASQQHFLGERKIKGAEKWVRSFSFYAEKHLFAKKKKNLLGIEAWERHGFIFSIMPVFLTQSKVLFPGMEGDR